MFDRLDKGFWWDKAWTLVEGCTPVSAGCDHCWAARQAARFDPHMLKYGHWSGVIVTRPDRMEIPLRRKKPTTWAIWNDLFHEDVPDEFIMSAFDIMADCPQHIFLIMTKRPERMNQFIKTSNRGLYQKNVWLGVTAENQEQADKRIPILLHTPAAKRFVSIEPILGPVDLRGITALDGDGPDGQLYWIGQDAGIDWVILGGESGLHARPMHPDWARSVRDQCQAAGVPFFLKQADVNGRLVKMPEIDGKVWDEVPV
jgi:protein gp37